MRQIPPWVLVLLGALIGVAAYLQALDYPFVYDDQVYITDNAKLAGLHLTEIWRLFTEPYNAAFEFLPLRDLSYWFDLTIFGQTPSAFRIHNILLYLLCLPLIYSTTLGLWRHFRPAEADSAPWAAAVVTALIALHPALVESVVWISGRKYILPNLFSMLALWLAVRAKREQGISAPHATAALVAFVAVMLSKSSYVALAPIIAMLWGIFWLDIPVASRRRILLLWPVSIMILAIFLVRVFIVSNNGYDRIPFYFGAEAVTRSLVALGWLTRLAVTPERRYLFYPVFEDANLPVMVVLGVAMLVLAVAGVIMLLRKRSLESFALVIFLMLCVPYMQLIPHAPPALVSDRYVAFAVWPAVLLLVVLAWRLNPVPRTVLLLVIASLWGIQTIGRTRDWRNFEVLLDSDLHDRPGYYLPAMYKIVGVQLPQGLYREASETANSITVPVARNIMIGLVKAHYAVNATAISSGKPQEAMMLLTELGLDHKQPPVQTQWNPSMHLLWEKRQHLIVFEWKSLSNEFPNDMFVHYNAGLWMLEFHDYKDAVVHLRKATESQVLPVSVRGAAFAGLGAALMFSGQLAEAEATLRTALTQTKADPRAYCMLSEVYKKTARFEDAARAEADCLTFAPKAEKTR